MRALIGMLFAAQRLVASRAASLRAPRRPLPPPSPPPHGRARRPPPPAAAKGAAPSPASVTTAKAAVEAGLEAFAAGDAAAALGLFSRALALRPDDDEARAALYNSACALTRLRRWQEAADAVVAAVNERGLKLAVAARDPDLAPLRERREWADAVERAAGGLSREAAVQLRSEARAPFRFARLVLVGGLASGAALALLVSGARLAAALGGADGAPELAEAARTLGVNAACLAALGALLAWDLRGRARDEAASAREESLAALRVALGPARAVPLAAFRGAARPVVVAGTRKQVARALAEAAPYQKALRARGVSVVPVVLGGGGGDEPEGAPAIEELRRRDEGADAKLRRLKAEFAAEMDLKPAAGEGGAGGGTSAAAAGKGFGAPTAAAAAAAAPAEPEGGASTAPGERVADADRRWELRAVGLPEWEAWLREQVRAAGGVAAGAYVQVQLDGSVRASGPGGAPWARLVADLPELDDVRTRLTDGAGRG